MTDDKPMSYDEEMRDAERCHTDACDHVEAARMPAILLSQWLTDHKGHDVFVAWIEPCRLICDECTSDDEWPLPEEASDE